MNDGGVDLLVLGVLVENEKGCGFFEYFGYMKEEIK